MTKRRRKFRELDFVQMLEAGFWPTRATFA